MNAFLQVYTPNVACQSMSCTTVIVTSCYCYLKPALLHVDAQEIAQAIFAQLYTITKFKQSNDDDLNQLKNYGKDMIKDLRQK